MNSIVVLLLLGVSGQTTGETSVQPKAHFATPHEPHTTISSEAPDGWTPPVPHYDDSDYYIDPSKPHLRFWKGKSSKEEIKRLIEDKQYPRSEKKYPYWEKNKRGEDVLWVATGDYYIREKEPSQREQEDEFFAKLGRDFFEAAASQSNLGENKLMKDLQIHKEQTDRRVYLNRLFRRIADYEMSTLPN